MVERVNTKPKGKFYICGDRYYIVTDDWFSMPLSKVSALTYCESMNIRGPIINKKELPPEPKVIKSLTETVDYFSPRLLTQQLDLSETHLTIIHNPIKNWRLDFTPDKRITDDYERVLNGKLLDIIELVYLSVKFHENKRNKLLLFGASDKGKTHLANLLGFIELTADEFNNTFGDDPKGMSQTKHAELTKSGLLLADDIKDYLPKSIKNIKDTAEVKVMYKGSVKTPVKFLIMTTTNDEILKTANDEITNRILGINIGTDKCTIRTSKIYLEDPIKYQTHCDMYIKKMIIEVLQDDYKISHLHKLQDRYKVNASANEHNETLEDVTQTFFKDYLESSLDGNVIKKKKKYYIKTKLPMKKAFKAALYEAFKGIHINASQDVSIFDTAYIGERTTLTKKGEVLKVYPLINLPK